MEKQVYLKEVEAVYKTLVYAIDQYNEKRMNIHEMQNIVRVCWMAAPKEFSLVDEELAETLGLEEKLVGSVIRVDDYFPGDLYAYKEYVEGLINDIPNWEKDPHGRFSVRGSNSLIPNIIGEPEWNYFAFGRK